MWTRPGLPPATRQRPQIDQGHNDIRNRNKVSSRLKPGMGTTVLRSTLFQGNLARLAVAQALAGANTTVVYATAAIIGNTLAPEKSLATMPISIFVVGMALSTL